MSITGYCQILGAAYDLSSRGGVHCSVIEHGMTSLSFQSAVQKNEAKLSPFVQFENEMACAL